MPDADSTVESKVVELSLSIVAFAAQGSYSPLCEPPVAASSALLETIRSNVSKSLVPVFAPLALAASASTSASNILLRNSLCCTAMNSLSEPKPPQISSLECVANHSITSDALKGSCAVFGRTSISCNVGFIVSAIKPPSAVPPNTVLAFVVFRTGLAVITLQPDLSQGYFGKIPKALASRLSCAHAYAPKMALNVPVVEVVTGASAFLRRLRLCP